MALYLTYDNTSLQDGLGAQALRIVGTYSVAKGFRLKYIHSPIENAIEDVSHNLQAGYSLQKLIDNVNSFFTFPGDKTPPTFSVLKVHTLSTRKLFKLILKYKFSSKNVVVSVLIPMPVLDKFPRLYSRTSKLLRKRNARILNSHKSLPIVAHVRRGYDEKYADKKYSTARHLPFSYFTSAILKSCQTFNPPKEVPIRIHTDLLDRGRTWLPQHEGVIQGFRRNSANQDANSIELEAFDLSNEIAAPLGYKLEFRYCDEFMLTFLDMCNAKVLIMAKSAFSYLAGVINPNHVVWPEVHSHRKLSRWHDSRSLEIMLSEALLG